MHTSKSLAYPHSQTWLRMNKDYITVTSLTACKRDREHLKFQIKCTTNNVLLANQQRPYQHCPQVKSHLSGSSSLPGHSQLMAEPSNSGGIQAPENFLSTKGQRSRFGPAPHQLG